MAKSEMSYRTLHLALTQAVSTVKWQLWFPTAPLLQTGPEKDQRGSPRKGRCPSWSLLSFVAQHLLHRREPLSMGHCLVLIGASCGLESLSFCICVVNQLVILFLQASTRVFKAHSNGSGPGTSIVHIKQVFHVWTFSSLCFSHKDTQRTDP